MTDDARVVELLVPGLGPVDPEEALRPATVRLMSGDESAGLYRVDESGGPGRGSRERVVREVYDWTRLTIGGASRALWLLLLPFLLINLVIWMQPRWPDGSDPRWRRAAGAIYEFGARIMALSLTVMVVGVAGQIAMDQIVWQCGSGTAAVACDPENPAVSVLSEQGLSVGTGLAVAAIAPFMVVFVLLSAARRSKQEYRPVLPTVSVEETERGLAKRDEDRGQLPLELPGFWEHHRRDHGMAAQHVWAGMLTTAALLTVPPLLYDRAAPGGAAAAVAGWGLIGVIGACWLVLLMSVPWFHRRVRWWPTRRPVPAAIFCVVVNVAAVVYCVLPLREWEPQRMLPGMGMEATMVLVAQGVGAALLVLTSVVLPRRGTRRGMSLRGLHGTATAVMACFSGWVFTTGCSMWAQEWLAPDEGRRPELPEPVDVVAGVFPVVLVATGLGFGAITAAVRLFRARPRTSAPARSRPADERRRLQDLVRARRDHRFGLRTLEAALGTSALVTVGAVALMYIPFDRQSKSEFKQFRDALVELLTALSGIVLVGLVAVMLVAVRALALRPEMRRNAGMAWAFGAFWPRAGHPFAPPSWTVRAVPELTRRLDLLLAEGRPVLLHGVSMGSLLALAAVWQLAPERRRRLALLTTGSPLRVHFSRVYPGFVCDDSIRRLAEPGQLAGWRNIWRDTDPMAGPVGIASVDQEWADGVDAARPNADQLERTPEQPVFAPIEKHRGYRTDDRLAAERNQLLAVLLPPVPAQPHPGHDS